jgi:hypothetical protein
MAVTTTGTATRWLGGAANADLDHQQHEMDQM